MRCNILIDYDNLGRRHQTSGILNIATRVLSQLPIDESISRVQCDIRVYGGWYEDNVVTRPAQEILVEIQKDFPHMMKFGNVSVLLNAELATAMLEQPSHHLFNTFRKKGKPKNIRVMKPSDIGCADPACMLPLVKKILRTGKCQKPGCQNSNNIIYRDEQKIVDTMLTCDIIYSATTLSDILILVSGDDDFIPPLLTILLRGEKAVRIHPQPNNQRIALAYPLANLIETDL